MGRSKQLALSVALACGLQTPLLADLLVVADHSGPGVDAIGIEAAISLAQDGDTLLLQEGQYGQAYINGKSLHLIADTGAAVRLRRIKILNLPADGTVALQGLELVGEWGEFTFHARDNLGSIWIDDCVIRGGPAYGFDSPSSATVVRDSSSVVFNRCHLLGTDVGATLNPGGPGLVVAGSSVYLLDTVARGGDSGPPPSNEPGTGVFALSGYLYVSGGAILGGRGRDASTLAGPCHDGGHGAPGLFTYMNSPQVVLVGVELLGGEGGAADSPCMQGAVGEAALNLSGEVAETDFSARSLSANSPVRGGEDLTFSFSGSAGDLVYLAYSIGTATTLYPLMDKAYSPLAGGPILMATDWSRSVPVGVLSPAGTLDVTYATYPITLPSAALFTQVVALSPDGGGLIHFGSGKLVTILGPGL